MTRNVASRYGRELYPDPRLWVENEAQCIQTLSQKR